jgi:hypothetical protein
VAHQKADTKISSGRKDPRFTAKQPWQPESFVFATLFICANYIMYFFWLAHKQCTLSCYVFPKNLKCNLSVFEPGPFIPEADAMATAPPRQGIF